MAHMGLSISSTSINDAIKNLSKDATTEIRRVGRQFTACYAYDNLDIDLKHSVPTLEQSEDTLVHLTSGTLFPLHGVTQEELMCSEELWEQSPFNLDASLPSTVPRPSLDDLFEIHPEPTPSSSTSDANALLGDTRRDRFNAWKFLSDLVHHGPDYFRQFKQNLKNPETIDVIPITKTQQLPLRCLNVKPSTAAENAEALNAFFIQTGVGDPDDDPHVVAVNNRCIAISGDLLTSQHARSLQESRALESSPWRRMQSIFFIMGLFHLKMACADAIWRIFIHPKNSRCDLTSLMSYVGQIRPKETGRIETKPGFRRMHEIIQHVGVASRLDIWRVEASKKHNGLSNLEDYALLKPSWDDLCIMATSIASDYVASDATLEQQQELPDSARDHQFENTLIRQQYFLLYEEITHAMNFGDIGRVELCFLPWMMIFAGCGKHKYATEMRRYLENVHFIFPPAIRKAIRMNILCNPTGKRGEFRGLDWVVEHNNLYIKVCQSE
jgi:hypothetical protein